MAFCANCGADVQGRFCAKCGSAAAAGGASVAAPPPPEAPTQPPPQQSYTPPPPQQNYAPPQQNYVPPQQDYAPPQQNYAPQGAQPAGLTDNVAAAVCYIFGWLTGVLFLVLAPYNQNRLIRFHAFQSIFLSLGMIVVWIGMLILSSVLSFIPFVGAVFSLVLDLAIGLGFFILWLMLMYKAYNNERWVLPVIGPLAEKQA